MGIETLVLEMEMEMVMVMIHLNLLLFVEQGEVVRGKLVRALVLMKGSGKRMGMMGVFGKERNRC